MLIAQSTGAGTADWLLEPKNQTASHYFLAIEKGAKYKKAYFGYKFDETNESDEK